MNNIQHLKGRGKGKRIFLIGNGPSLNDMNLDLLVGEEKLNELYDFLSKYFVIQKNNKNLWFCQNKLLSL